MMSNSWSFTRNIEGSELWQGLDQCLEEDEWLLEPAPRVLALGDVEVLQVDQLAQALQPCLHIWKIMFLYLCYTCNTESFLLKEPIFAFCLTTYLLVQKSTAIPKYSW